MLNDESPEAVNDRRPFGSWLAVATSHDGSRRYTAAYDSELGRERAREHFAWALGGSPYRVDYYQLTETIQC